MVADTKVDLKRHSRAVSEGPDRAPARSMLRAVGLGDEDMDKPFVAIGNLASDVTPATSTWTGWQRRSRRVSGPPTACPSCSAPSRSATAYPWAPRA